jgi:hypothetical protein
MSRRPDDRNEERTAAPATVATLSCAACAQPLYVGQPMTATGDARAHVGCDVVASIRSQYGDEALRRETLPPLLRSRAA